MQKAKPRRAAQKARAVHQQIVCQPRAPLREKRRLTGTARRGVVPVGAGRRHRRRRRRHRRARPQRRQVGQVVQHGGGGAVARPSSPQGRPPTRCRRRRPRLGRRPPTSLSARAAAGRARGGVPPRSREPPHAAAASSSGKSLFGGSAASGRDCGTSPSSASPTIDVSDGHASRPAAPAVASKHAAPRQPVPDSLRSSSSAMTPTGTSRRSRRQPGAGGSPRARHRCTRPAAVAAAVAAAAPPHGVVGNKEEQAHRGRQAGVHVARRRQRRRWR